MVYYLKPLTVIVTKNSSLDRAIFYRKYFKVVADRKESFK